MRPNLFLIGNPKCGTTACYEFLKQHPSISMTEQKELHALDKQGWDEETYSRQFDSLKNAYVGEATPTYFHHNKAVRRIHQINPESKLLVILREPTSFLVSRYEHEQRRNGNKSLSPSEIFNAKREDYNQDWTDYASDLERVLQYFPPEQVYVTLFEQFRNNNKAVMNDIFDFLDLNPHQLDTGEYNESLRCRIGWLDKLIVKYDLGRIANLLPYDLRNIVVEHAKKFLFEKKDTKQVEQHKQRFRSNVVATQELLREEGFEAPNVLEIWNYSR